MTKPYKEYIKEFDNLSLMIELKAVFSYYGNAVHNSQSERIDDAIDRYDALENEIFNRLKA